MNKTEVCALVYKNLRIATKKRAALLLNLVRPLYFIIFLILVGISLTNLVDNGYFTFMVSGMGLWLIFSSAFVGSATSYVREGNSLESLNPLPFDKRSVYVASGLAECMFAAPSTAIQLAIVYWYTTPIIWNLLLLVVLIGIGTSIALHLGGLCALATTKTGWLNQSPRILERALFLSSGAFYYTTIIPTQVQTIFKLLPHTQFVSLGRELMIGKSDVLEHWFGLAVLLVWLLILVISQGMLKKHYELLELK